MSPWKSEEGVGSLGNGAGASVGAGKHPGSVRVLSALSPKLSHFSTCSFYVKVRGYESFICIIKMILSR